MNATLLDIVALMLGLIHFGVPLAYYFYMKKKYLNKPWNIRVDENYRPKVSIILPTYNESRIIQARLDNIRGQDYPKSLMEVIVVDSNSSDGTAELVEESASRHRDIELRLIREGERRGKAHALNHGLKHATGEIVVIADADAMWPREALSETMKWFADPGVGAVSCLKKPVGSGVNSVEEGYREYYNVLRIAESKAHATPVFHGELGAFRRSLLEKLNGFPTDIGADDSHTATRIALMGYRAITPENILVEEIVPERGYFWWRVRRAQHLIQHFAKTLWMMKQAPREFKWVLAVEAFLHLVNPFLLLASITLLVASIATAQSTLALAITTLGVVLLVVKPYRTWIAQQLHLIIATFRNLKNKEIVWDKQVKS
ncbi:glycosyltransferase family 2 protein [Thermosphaera chiliense]|uniref:Glycosyltransferase family 2 protein n=1 Tax=Thermosphaera chiliense TaxID=3402707 RepID=A0A7M1UQP8_9CREN|nr:glycosyltransferase family 2 protein [Thermosphaera aggregans]QOR94570.1 glycosyltransferase family 2 protein [Thermosphaera aggregans]